MSPLPTAHLPCNSHAAPQWGEWTFAKHLPEKWLADAALL